MKKLMLNDDRPQMEALYILLHMGNTEALMRGLQLPPDLRKSPNVQLSIKISFAWYLKNYVRVCSLIPQLPPLLICAAMTGIQKLRRMALKIMSSGYNNKVFTFPGLKLQQLLLYKDIDKIRADCELLGLVFVNQNILFQKANFKDEVQLTHPEMYYTDQSLHSVLPGVLLESKFDLFEIFQSKLNVWILLSGYQYSLVNISLITAKKLYIYVSALICVSVNL